MKGWSGGREGKRAREGGRKGGWEGGDAVDLLSVIGNGL